MLANPAETGVFDDIVRQLPEDLASICKTLKARIIAAAPQSIEIVWPRQGIASYGVGPKKMSQHYLYIAPQKAHVNLGFYYGAALADPDQVLVGAGKAMRHIKIATLDQMDGLAITALIDAAISERMQALGKV